MHTHHKLNQMKMLNYKKSWHTLGQPLERAYIRVGIWFIITVCTMITMEGGCHRGAAMQETNNYVKFSSANDTLYLAIIY